MDYYDDLLYMRQKAWDAELKSARKNLSRKNYTRVRQLYRENIGTEEYLFLPMSIKYKDVVRILVNACRSEGIGVIIDRDEIHWGAGEDSVNDRMFGGQGPKNDNVWSEDEIYHLLNDDNYDAQFVAVSATNWAAVQLDVVRIPVNESYRGIDFACFDRQGEPIRIADGVAIKPPEIFGMTEFVEKFNNPCLQYLRPSWYFREDSFLGALEKDNLPFFGHTDYRRQMEAGIADAVVSLFAHKPHKGLLMRLVVDNKMMEEFIPRLVHELTKRHHGDIKIVRAFDIEHETVDELLDINDVGPDDRYIYIPTARARMGDTFPTGCDLGMDFTYKSNTLASLLQGVFGRVCGYGKDPTILLSDYNAQVIRGYVENDNFPMPGMKLLPHASTRSGRRRHFPVDLANHGHIPEIAAMAKRISKKLVNSGHFIKIKKSKNGKREKWLEFGKNKVEFSFWQECVREDDFEFLNELCRQEMNRELLKPTEMDDYGECYNIETDAQFAAIKNANPGDVFDPWETYPEITARYDSQESKKGGRHTGRPTVIIRYIRKGRGFKLTGFDLMLNRVKKPDISIEASVPKKIKPKGELFNGEL
jgi:hypothetical protein